MKTSLLDRPKASLSQGTLFLSGMVLIAILLMPSMHARAQSTAPAKAETHPSNSSRQYLKPVKDPLAVPPQGVEDSLFLSRDSGKETDPILRVFGDYPSTEASLGRLMGDRRARNYRDPTGKVVAFEVLKNGDVLFGPNLGVARRLSDDDDPNSRLETDPQHSAPIDFYWDARDRKLHVRSILLTENGDPADLAFRRAGDETYPYGPPQAVKAGTNLGTIYWMGWGADDYGFNDRTAQIYAKSAEDITEKGSGGTLFFSTTPIGSTKPADRAVISNEGYVGIGTTVPQAMLHVAGDVAGVAEDYPSIEKLEPGDVVSIDDSVKTLTITRAATPYDQRVVGVVATRPAVRISQLEAGALDNAEMKPRSDVFPVAHAGRVAVKVSAENGAIRPGDYLTSSSKPGVSMKATTKGAIVGKALQSYSEQTEGKIQMLADVTWYQP